MSGAKTGKKTKFYREGVAVVEILRIALAGTKETFDASSMDSPNSDMEFITGMKDGGELSIEANWIADAASHVTMLNDYGEEDAHQQYSIVWPDASQTVCTIRAFVTGFAVNTSHNAKSDATYTLKITGGVLWGTGGSTTTTTSSTSAP